MFYSFVLVFFDLSNHLFLTVRTFTNQNIIFWRITTSFLKTPSSIAHSFVLFCFFLTRFARSSVTPLANGAVNDAMKLLYSGHDPNLKIVSVIEKCPLHRGSS